jgi:hypothetical protein
MALPKVFLWKMGICGQLIVLGTYQNSANNCNKTT